jgi:hypothetical protein
VSKPGKAQVSLEATPPHYHCVSQADLPPILDRLQIVPKYWLYMTELF